jgi:hypothetical protein
MRKTAVQVLLFTALGFFGQFALSSAAPPKNPATEPESRPFSVSDATDGSNREEHLRKGEIFTDGGYLKKGVWGVMEGVIEAPPKIVWRLFVNANDWKYYKLPQLTDSRAVSEEVAKASEPLKKVDEFYKMLGERSFDPMDGQKPNTVWTNYTFQYYDLPWPVSNKWIVLKNLNDETQSSKLVYRCSWDKSAGNVKSLSGEFRLEPFEGNPKRTLLYYRVETDPGSSVPKFLMRWGIKKSLPTAMRIIRRESIKLAARPSPILHTQ